MNLKNKIFPILFFVIFFFLLTLPLLGLLLNINMEGASNALYDKYFWFSVLNTFVASFFAALLSLFFALGLGYMHLFYSDWLIYKFMILISELPSSLPHPVAGLALLLIFGPNKFFNFFNLPSISFSSAAVVLAMTFVSVPIAIKTIVASLDKMDREILNMALLLGRAPGFIFKKIVIPQIKLASLFSFTLTFARASSEFAAVVLFGGNVAGRTQVLASYVYNKLEEGELDTAIFAGTISLLFSLTLTVGINQISKKYAHR